MRQVCDQLLADPCDVSASLAITRCVQNLQAHGTWELEPQSESIVLADQRYQLCPSKNKNFVVF
jgi:hypothetical protein